MVTYIAEHSPIKRRGFYTAFLQSGATFLFLLASVVVLLVTVWLPQESFDTWRWRIPFLLALPLGGVATYLRLRLEESPVFMKLRNEGALAKTPLRKALFQGIAIVALTFSANFVFLSFTEFTSHGHGWPPLPLDTTSEARCLVARRCFWCSFW